MSPLAFAPTTTSTLPIADLPSQDGPNFKLEDFQLADEKWESKNSKATQQSFDSHLSTAGFPPPVQMGYAERSDEQGR